MRPISKKPKKQRKYEKNVPLHEKHKLVSAHLSPELRQEHGFRSLPVRPKDEVVILRGDYKGIKGKVTSVHPQKHYITVDKATMKKNDNTEIPAKIHPSNVMIVKFHKTKDRFRIGLINRRTVEEDARIDFDSIEEEEEIVEMGDEDFEDLENEDLEEDYVEETEDYEDIEEEAEEEASEEEKEDAE